MGAHRATVVATWLWRSPEDVRPIVEFVTRRSLREVYLGIPLSGVDKATHDMAKALRTNGIAVEGLGGDPAWTLDVAAAVSWAKRATADSLFDTVHLDVEPWASPRWPRDADKLMRSYATLVEKVAEVAPLAVDIVPWLLDAHRDTVSRVVERSQAITVLAYRDSADGIVAAAGGLLELCEAHGRRYRVGVETQQPSASVPASTTFGDDGQAVMDRELAKAAERIAHPAFAVHHVASWRSMPA